MRKRILSLMLAALLLLTMTSCASEGAKSGKLSVVTTNFALYDFARAVCGDTCEVTMLLRPGSEAHDFEATLEDVAKIADADLFVYVGGESEDWVGDVMNSLGSDAEKITKVCAVDAVNTFDEELVEGMEDESEEKADEPETDEHIWTSFENAQALAEAIFSALCRIDPDHEAAYGRNLTAYKQKLAGLRMKYEEMFASAGRKTVVVADRFPFRYLAEEWGLDYYAAFAGCSSAVEPSLATVNFLIEKVKNERIPAVFIIEFSDGKTAGAVAAETGCEVLTLHSAHNVTQEDFDAGVTWLELMERNLEALRTALN